MCRAFLDTREASGKRNPEGGRLLFQDDEVGTTVFGGDIIGGVFGGFEVALGEDFDFISGNAEVYQVLAGRSGTTVAKAEVILGGAAPVAATFDQEPMEGVALEVGLGGIQFGALGGGDGRLIVGKVDGLEEAADRFSVVYNAFTGFQQAAALGLQIVLGVGVVEAINAAGGQVALLSDNGCGGVWTFWFFTAAGSEKRNGGEDDEEDFAGEHVHKKGVV